MTGTPDAVQAYWKNFFSRPTPGGPSGASPIIQPQAPGQPTGQAGGSAWLQQLGQPGGVIQRILNRFQQFPFWQQQFQRLGQAWGNQAPESIRQTPRAPGSSIMGGTGQSGIQTFGPESLFRGKWSSKPAGNSNIQNFGPESIQPTQVPGNILGTANMANLADILRNYTPPPAPRPDRGQFF